MERYEIRLTDRDGSASFDEEHRDMYHACCSATVKGVSRLVGDGCIDGKHVVMCKVLENEASAERVFQIAIQVTDVI